MDILDNLRGVDIILASGSPRRRELLQQLGLKFNVKVSNTPEIPTGDSPEEVVEGLSREKAEAVACDILKNNLKDYRCVIIAADTAVFLNNIMLGKPSDEKEAYKMIAAIQGRNHVVYTGVTVAIINAGEVKYKVFSVGTTVSVSPMTDYEIACYINKGESLDKAGAYGIQGSFSAFVRGIEGDYNNVVGLPLEALYRELKNISLI